MQNDRIITISTAGSRKATNWQPQIMRISELFDRLKTPLRDKETLSVYMSLKKAQQDELKDKGGFVGGELTGRRKKGSVRTRDVITLDMDNCPVDSTSLIIQRIASLGMMYAVYSTRKHSPAAPRLRVVVPTDRTITGEEYEPIARKLAALIQPELTWFDPTTFQVERLMYWPSCCIDSEYIFTYEDKPLLSADGILAKYNDWRTVTEWPQVPGEQKLRETALKKQGDPTEKKGTIGAFCKVYSAVEAMEKFLPGVYAPTEQSDRYTFVGGSTAGGAIVYDDEKFLFSHHATDPCSEQLVNAFDLVRLHKFGHLDDDAKEGTPTNRLPSYVEMCSLANSDKTVLRILDEERRETAIADFDGLESDENWLGRMQRNGNKVLQTINNCKLVLFCDLQLKGKFGLNEFTNKNMVLGVLPWNEAAGVREWTDSDDAGLRNYLESNYELTRKAAVDDAWLLINEKNKFHPVRDYLNGCIWDGVPRVDMLFIDYNGAEDTPYTRAVTRKALCASVARVFEPGIKFDNMLVLVGGQGTGKSTTVKKLGGEWFSDTLTTMQGKEAYEQIQGNWLIEIAELSAMKKGESDTIKHFLSKSEDTFRKAYGRRTHTYKRQCVFIGTTNKYEFLQDMTGNRRFWPIDTDIAKATKSIWRGMDAKTVRQIWAEAVQLWRNGETLYLPRELEEMAQAVQEEHRDQGDAEGLILAYLEKPLPVNWYDLSVETRQNIIRGSSTYQYIGEKPAEALEPLAYVCALAIKREALEPNVNANLISSQNINQTIEKTGGFKRGKSMKINPYGKQRTYYRQRTK